MPSPSLSSTSCAGHGCVCSCEHDTHTILDHLVSSAPSVHRAPSWGLACPCGVQPPHQPPLGSDPGPPSLRSVAPSSERSVRGEGDASVAIYAISYYYLQAGFTFNRTVGRGQNAKRGRKRKLLIDGFAAPQAEPLRVSEFQAHPGTHHECGACRDCFSFSRASPWRAVEAQKGQLERNPQSSIERGVNATDHRCEW
jgi:hypothetical protein